MRSDFLLQDNMMRKYVVEIKLVVDTDYDASCVHDKDIQSLYLQNSNTYERSALFPWGRSHQKDDEGNKVISARAIKHVKELTRLVQNDEYKSIIVFMVCRSDACSFTPNKYACPKFVDNLTYAINEGVDVHALKISFDQNGCWSFEKELPIIL